MTLRCIVYIFALIFLLSGFSKADIVHLKGDKKLYGQIVTVAENAIYFEILDSKSQSIKTLSLPRSQVLKIIDESGLLLYESNQPKYEIFKPYYKKIINNWEELNDRFKSTTNDSIYFKDKSIQAGKIINITEAYIFIEIKPTAPEEFIEVKKYLLKNVSRINRQPVFFLDSSRPKFVFKKDIEYPVYSISVGLAYSQTNFNELQSLFQNFYMREGLSAKAAERQADYLGLQGNVEVYISPFWSFALMGHLFTNDKVNAFNLSAAQIKFHFSEIFLKPWIGTGIAGQAISSSEKIEDITYTWQASKSSLLVGAGINTGEMLGTGFGLSGYYMPFGRFKTQIDESTEIISKKIDFTIFMISLNMHFNFN